LNAKPPGRKAAKGKIVKQVTLSEPAEGLEKDDPKLALLQEALKLEILNYNSQSAAICWA
jgi:hypothetical protein